MKKIATILVLCVSISTSLVAQNVPIEKFIGIWNASDNNWTGGTMKISQENGKIIVQVKDFVYGEAELKGDRLEMTVVEKVNYGEFWVGSYGRHTNWVLVGHSDGTYGTDGEVGGFYSENTKLKANKEIEYISVAVVYKYEGTLELYYNYHSTYYRGDTPLFYQGKREELYIRPWNPIVYTNW